MILDSCKRKLYRFIGWKMPPTQPRRKYEIFLITAKKCDKGKQIPKTWAQFSLFRFQNLN